MVNNRLRAPLLQIFFDVLTQMFSILEGITNGSRIQ